MERRRHHRVQLRTPLRGAVRGSSVLLMDGSLGGVGLAHGGTLPVPGSFCRVDLTTDWGPIRMDCQVVRTAPLLDGPDPAPKSFHSGLQIVVIDRQSAQRLETLMEAVSDDDF